MEVWGSSVRVLRPHVGSANTRLNLSLVGTGAAFLWQPLVTCLEVGVGFLKISRALRHPRHALVTGPPRSDRASLGI